MTHPCPLCGASVERRETLGRPPVYCSCACRQAAYRRRRTDEIAHAEARLLDVLARVADLVPTD